MKEYRITRTNILLKQQEKAKQSTGGIFLPESSTMKPLQGTIEGVGPDVETVKKGDEVLFDRFAGVQIVLEEEPYLILSEEDILLIFGK